MKWPVSRERFDEMRERLRDTEVTLAQARAGVTVALEAAREHHTAEIARIHALYEKMLEQQAKAQNLAIEQLMNLIQFGQPTRTEAVVEEREPDAALRAARRVSEETIAVAVENLRKEYEKIGVPVTDEELATEARSLMLGERYVPPASLAGMLRD